MSGRATHPDVCGYCGGDIEAGERGRVECCGVPFHESCYESHVERDHEPRP